MRLGDSGLSVLVLERDGLQWKAMGESQEAEKGDFFRKILLTDILMIGISNLGQVVCWDRREKRKGNIVYRTSFVIEWQNLQAKATNDILVVWSDHLQKLIGFKICKEKNGDISVLEVWRCVAPESGYIHLHDLSQSSHLLVENNTDDRYVRFH